uniref:Odorant receptor n=1 Tax=Anopheles epiroticus TaxID=199890 RepID=A0A182P3F0_9DIPT
MLFYDLQRAFSFVMNDQCIEIQQILGHITKSTNLLTMCYSSILCFDLAVYGIFPMLFTVVKFTLTGSYDVPLRTPTEAKYCIPHFDTNIWIWMPLNAVLNMLLELHGLAVVFVECFTWSLVYAICCMFRILHILSNKLSDKTLAKEQWAVQFKHMKTLHDTVLRSARTLEEIMCGQLLWLYLSTIFALCLGMVVLSLAIEEVYLLFMTFTVFGYCIFQTFSFSYLGTELIEQSSAVSDAIFHSAWYTQDVKRQKDLCFVLLRANKPVRLTAAKFFVVTRDSFTQLVCNENDEHIASGDGVGSDRDVRAARPVIHFCP